MARKIRKFASTLSEIAIAGGAAWVGLEIVATLAGKPAAWVVGGIVLTTAFLLLLKRP